MEFQPSPNSSKWILKRYLVPVVEPWLPLIGRF